MFKHVLVGVDDREGGRDAIALARTLADDGAEITFGYVYAGDSHALLAPSPTQDPVERERVGQLLERARDAAGIAAELRWRPSSSVGRGLHELAEHAGSDVLVIGSSRRGLLGRVLVGDSTRAALDGAPCAVAVAPAGYSLQPAPLNEIGIGYDGSAESEHALQVARELAARHQAKLSALDAVNVPALLTHGRTAADGTPLQDLVDQARERLAALDGVDGRAVYGDPAEELAVFGESLGLLVIGSRSYGPFGRMFHGSTAHELTRRARCPLLVLTRAVREVAPMPPAANGAELTAASSSD